MADRDRRIARRRYLGWAGAALLVSFIDMLLTINNAKNMGRFLLLLTMTSTFDITPENVIGDYCETERNQNKPLCTTYLEMMEKGGLTFKAEMSGRSFYAYHDINAESGEEQVSAGDLGATLSIQRFVTSQKSTFDPSRTPGNISFYLDDEHEGRIQDHHLLTRNSHWHSTQERQKHSLSQSLTSNLNQKKGGERGENQVDRKKERDKSSHLNSELKEGYEFDPDLDQHMLEKAGDSVKPPKEVRNQQEIESERRKRLAPTFVAVDESDKDKSKGRENNNRSALSSLSLPNNDGEVGGQFIGNKEAERLTMPGERETKRKPKKSLNSLKSILHLGGNDDLKDSKEEEEGFSEEEPGPKYMINYLTQEIFAQWHNLLENAQVLINKPPRKQNLSLEEQFKSPEAKGITMHIQLQPFGPDTFKFTEIRKKAIQQTLYDNPYSTIRQLEKKLSGNFAWMITAICFYTWVWDTLLSTILSYGIRKDNPTVVQGWMIFNILLSTMYYMIENWIHYEIHPIRCSIDYWFFNFYSLYKVVAFTIVAMLWYHMKPFDTQRRRATQTKISYPLSSSSSLSSGTTKESTIVDINMTESLPSSNAADHNESNTAAALVLASALRQASKTLEDHQQQHPHTNTPQKQDLFEEEDCEEDEESDSSYVDSETEDETEQDLEKGESVIVTPNIVPPAPQNNLIIRGCGYVVQQ